MRHYPYGYTLWYNLEQAMKCDIYLKLWFHAQNCLICTLHPSYCEKKLSIRYGAHNPVRVSCSHCHVVDVMNDIVLCYYAGFVLNVCLLNRCGKCTYMAISTFWIWIWIWLSLNHYPDYNESVPSINDHQLFPNEPTLHHHIKLKLFFLSLGGHLFPIF